MRIFLFTARIAHSIILTKLLFLNLYFSNYQLTHPYIDSELSANALKTIAIIITIAIAIALVSSIA